MEKKRGHRLPEDEILVSNSINKIKIISKCKECGHIDSIGENTRQCLQCLDWKMNDLYK